jgi:hypothetical protein
VLASNAGRPSGRVRAALLAMGAFLMVGAFSYLRGFDATLPPGGYLYSQLTYEDGFIRRGLLGSVVSIVRRGGPTDDIAGLVLGVHLLASLLIIVVLGLWLGYLILSVADRAGAWLLVAVSGLFLSSQFLPTLGFLGGFVDGVLIAVLVAAAALVASGRLVTGSLVAAAGPLLHETFLALWVPVAVAGLALWLRDGHRERRRAVWLMAPLVTTVLVLALHDESALARQVRSIVPDDASATWIIDAQFHQSAVVSVRATIERLPTSWDVDLWALVVFTLPALVTIALVVLAYRGRLGHWDVIALVAAVVSPMAILLVATDISRFLVIVNLVTFTVVLMLLSRPRVASSLPRTVLAGVGLMCLVGLLMPLVYLDVDAGDVFENGLLRIWGAPQSRP